MNLLYTLDAELSIGIRKYFRKIRNQWIFIQQVGDKSYAKTANGKVMLAISDTI